MSTSDFRFIRAGGGFFLSALRKKEGGVLSFKNVFILYVTAQGFSGCLIPVADQKEKAKRIRPYSHFL